MNLNTYKSLVGSIHVPAGLNETVLRAAQDQRVPARRAKPLLRIAVCAVCAVALAAGSLTRQMEPPAQREMEYSLGLTVSATGYGANGAVILRTEADAETLAGTFQTLTVTANGDDARTGDYYLTMEKLRSFVREDGETVLIPALSGDDRAGETVLYAVPAESRWISWPVAGCDTVSLSHAFGRSETPAGSVFHAGIDIPGQQEQPVTAAADGTVKETGFDPQRGNYIVLDHGGGLETVYAQCHSLTAAEGETVMEGDTIALLGSTGMSTGPHLCFQVWQDGAAQNPVAYFDAETRGQLKTE